MVVDFKKYNCIAILGGTFNPIHEGHINMARSVYSQFKDIEKIILMPNNLPTYKDNREMVDISDRLSMLELAISGLDYCLISDIEIQRGGITYTIDTLEELKCLNPRLRIYYIIGADSLYSFEKWHRYDEILKCCTLLAITRNTDYDKMQEHISKLKRLVPECDIRIAASKNIDISSSAIRQRISEGDYSITDINPSVLEYIKAKGLYKKQKHT